MRNFLAKMIQGIARDIVQQYKPIIVGVTGSVGKTSTKEMVVAVMSGALRVRGTPKSYNNEFGLPLSIIGQTSPGKSVLGWIRVLLQGWRIKSSKDPTFPQMLVLEMGADHPGDIAKLTAIAPPRVGILTAVGSSHAAFYDSLESIAKEKKTLIDAVPKDGLAILNADDEVVWAMRTGITALHVGVGFGEHAAIRATGIEEFFNAPDAPVIGGIRGVLVAGDEHAPFVIPGVFGLPQVRALMAAAAVGLFFNMTLKDIVQAARRYAPPPGRMRLIAGIKQTTILDDTYNASPQSLLAALETFGRVSQGQNMVRYAVIADMLELGTDSVGYHESVGQEMGASVDMLITVGEHARALGQAAVAAGLPKDSWLETTDASAAGKLLQERVKPGDIILIKGSRGMHMEKAVQEIMADPLHAADLLVQ